MTRNRVATTRVRTQIKKRSKQAFKIEGLEPKQVYELLSAVRGPDHCGAIYECLKEHITARVRSIMFPERQALKGLASYNDTPLDAGSFSALAVRLWMLRKARRAEYDEHFLIHLRDAVDASKSHFIWNGLQYAVISLLNEIRYRHADTLMFFGSVNQVEAWAMTQVVNSLHLAAEDFHSSLSDGRDL